MTQNNTTDSSENDLSTALNAAEIGQITIHTDSSTKLNRLLKSVLGVGFDLKSWPSSRCQIDPT